MKIKQSVKNTWRKGRIFRYRTYKKMGITRHRRRIDIALAVVFTLCLTTFPMIFINREDSCPSDQFSEGNEVIHGDLGDEPVVSAKQASLDELEKKAQLGELKIENQMLDKGESLLGLLSRAKVPANERMAIVEALEIMIDLKSLRPGLSFMLFKTKTDEIQGLSIQLKGAETVAVVKEPDGSWTPFTAAGRIETHIERKVGTVERTFSGSAKKFEIPDTIISQIEAALNGEVDFSTDINPEDTFDVIYETKTTPSGLEIGTKQLLFIGMKLQRKEIYRYAFTNGAGLTSFYDARGRTGAKEIMKRPLKARGRLSSPYGKRRHPILKYEIFHHGVDLAAPSGIPIMAAADGVITQLGRKGGYGKYIRMRHSDGYQTAYGHMSGYRQDLKVGSKVKRGETIGYVGNTGRSTGPHLHFEVIKNNKTVNPFGNNVIPSKQLKGFELEQFYSMAEELHPDFEMHRAGKLPPVQGLRPF